MICSCGKRCDFMRAEVVVDTLEKEYYCLPCASYSYLTKDSKGNHTMKDAGGHVYKTWNISGD